MEKPQPTVIKLFDDHVFDDLRTHVAHIRKLYDWPGADYHDKGTPTDNLFNRWFWHNPPELVRLHHSVDLLVKAKQVFGLDLKPSYAFLSMYGKEGICPPHTDRPQCQYTIDLEIDSDGSWPIYVEEKPYVLEAGEALCYSGTMQRHYRKSMAEDGKGCTFMNLGFFHFVPIDWMGPLS